jgi:O-antigen/teichoic acid export membrane protein
VSFDLLTRLRSHRNDAVVAGSAWALLSVGVAAVSGALFWLVAARLHPGVEVGRASALFTSVLFVNYATGMGLQVAVARYAADRSDDSAVMFLLCALYTFATSVTGGVVYLALAHPRAAQPLTAHHIVGPIGFALLVAGSSLAQLVEIRLMALRRWALLVGRVAVLGAVRLPLLWIKGAGDGSVLLFIFAIAPVALSGYVLAPGLWLRGSRGPRRRPPFLASALRFSMVNYLSTLALQAPAFVVPVIVLLNVSAVTNANFYVAWSVASIVFLIPATIGQVLLVEAGRPGSDVDAQFRRALLAAVSLMALTFVVGALASSLVTSLYGPTYQQASAVLPGLLAAGVPWAITSVCLAEVRVRHDSLVTILITVVLAVAVVVPASFLVPNGGLRAAEGAWLGGHLLAAGGAALLTAWSRRRRPEAGGPAPAQPSMPVPEALAAISVEQA